MYSSNGMGTCEMMAPFPIFFDSVKWLLKNDFTSNLFWSV